MTAPGTGTPDRFEADEWQQDINTPVAALVRLLRALGYDPARHCASEESDDLLALADRVVRRYTCPHCDPCHGHPHRASWGARVASAVDGDGQPTHLIVQPSDGAHVAQSDADWLFMLIRDRLCVHLDALPEVSPEIAPSGRTSRRRWGRGA